MGFRTIFVKNGDKLRLKLDNLIVEKSGESFTIPLDDIESIVLEGEYTTITTRLMEKIAKHHIAVVFCDKTFHPCGIFLGTGQYHHSAKRAIWQSSWSDLMKKETWTVIVSQKIKNQIRVAELLNTTRERIALMESLANDIVLGDETNREGMVAKVYFNSLYGMGFSREDNILPNVCMNYGYSIIRAQVARSIVAVGLLPMLGIFHKNEFNAFNLVDDLMEPLRPMMDHYILMNVLDESENYLSYDKRLILIDFLNQKIKIKNKKMYLNQAIDLYINSFIKAMEKADWSLIIPLDFNQYLECAEK